MIINSCPLPDISNFFCYNPFSFSRKPGHTTLDLQGKPVLKLNPMSMRKMVSETQLNTTQRIERSSLKKEMATGRMIRFATNSSSMHRSQ